MKNNKGDTSSSFEVTTYDGYFFMGPTRHPLRVEDVSNVEAISTPFSSSHKKAEWMKSGIFTTRQSNRERLSELRFLISAANSLQSLNQGGLLCCGNVSDQLFTHRE